MQCPLCKVEMRSNSRYEYAEGNPPAFFIVHEYLCRNKNCGNFNRTVETVKKQLDVGKQS